MKAIKERLKIAIAETRMDDRRNGERPAADKKSESPSRFKTLQGNQIAHMLAESHVLASHKVSMIEQSTSQSKFIKDKSRSKFNDVFRYNSSVLSTDNKALKKTRSSLLYSNLFKAHNEKRDTSKVAEVAKIKVSDKDSATVAVRSSSQPEIVNHKVDRQIKEVSRPKSNECSERMSSVARIKETVARKSSQVSSQSRSVKSRDLEATKKLTRLVGRSEACQKHQAFSRTQSQCDMTQLVKLSETMKRQLLAKFQKDEKEKKFIENPKLKHKRGFTTLDRYSTCLDSFRGMKSGKESKLKKSSKFDKTAHHTESPCSKDRKFKTLDHDEFTKTSSTNNGGLKRSTLKQVMEKIGLGRMSSAKTYEPESHTTAFGVDGPSVCPPKPTFFSEFDAGLSKINLQDIEKQFTFDFNALFCATTQVEEKQQTATFTFNNDILSKKNSIITFKDDSSHDKQKRLDSSAQGYRSERRKSKNSEAKSEMEVPGGSVATSPRFSNQHGSRFHLMGLCEKADSKKVLRTKLNLPRPERVQKDKSLVFTPDNLNFEGKLGCSDLGSLFEGRLDSSDGNAIEKYQLFQSTESLLLKIERELKAEGVSSPKAPKVSPNQSNRNSANKYIKSSDSIIIVSNCTQTKSIDDKPIQGQRVPRECLRRISSSASMGSMVYPDLFRETINSQPTTRVLPTMKVVDLSPFSRALRFPFRMARTRRSAKHHFVDYSELDIVCLTLPRLRLAVHDITTIEPNEPHKAPSIDDRDLKSLLCLQSIDSKKLPRDILELIQYVDGKFEKESFVYDQSFKKPPRGAMKSQRTYDRMDTDGQDTTFSPLLGRKPAFKNSRLEHMMYKSGSMLARADRADDGEIDLFALMQNRGAKRTSLMSQYSRELPVYDPRRDSFDPDYGNTYSSLAERANIQLRVADPSHNDDIVYLKPIVSSIPKKSRKARKQVAESETINQLLKVSLTDTYYLSSDGVTAAKTKSSKLFSFLQNSEHRLTREVCNPDSNKSDASFLGQSSSGLPSMMFKPKRAPDSFSDPNLLRAQMKVGEPLSDKVKVAIKEEPEIVLGTKKFNFFSCSSSAQTSAHKPFSEIQRLVNQQFINIEDIKRIPEIEESRCGAQTPARPLIDLPDRATNQVNLDEDVGLGDGWTCDRPKRSSMVVCFDELNTFIFQRSKASCYKVPSSTARSRSNKSVLQKSKLETERSLNSRRSTKRVSFDFRSKESQPIDQETHESAYQFKQPAVIPKLALDRLKKVASDRSLANKENDKSQMSKNQISESDFGDLMMSVQDSDKDREFSAKENAYLTKVINQEVKSSRLNSRSNPILFAKHRSSVSNVEEDALHFQEIQTSKEIDFLAESYM